MTEEKVAPALLSDEEIFAIYEAVERDGIGSYLLGVARAIERAALDRAVAVCQMQGSHFAAHAIREMQR